MSFLAGALLIAILASISKFKFKFEIGIVELLQLTIAVGVGFYLQHLLSARSSDDRIEKDLIIDRLKSVNAEVDAIAVEMRREVEKPSNPDERRRFVGMFRRLSNDTYQVECLLKETPIRIDLSRFKCLPAKQLALKALVTGNAFPSQNMSIDLLGRYEKESREFSKAIFRLIFYINRL